MSAFDPKRTLTLGRLTTIEPRLTERWSVDDPNFRPVSTSVAGFLSAAFRGNALAVFRALRG
jgi:hypothetical protein